MLYFIASRPVAAVRSEHVASDISFVHFIPSKPIMAKRRIDGSLTFHVVVLYIFLSHPEDEDEICTDGTT